MVRLHYLDNLRWMCILVLFPLHAAFVFCSGWYGYYVLSDYTSTAAHCLAVVVEPWIMPVLFSIAGISTKFALQKRTPQIYLKERVTKLLVPFLAGLVFICPVIAYYAQKFHNGYTGSFFGAFVQFFSSVQNVQGTNGITGGFSADHLWFILFLFIISVLALGVILLLQRQERLHVNFGNVRLPVLCLLFIPVWILNIAGINVAGYSFVSYFAIFLIGYYLFSMDTVLARLEKYWAGLLAAWIVLIILVMWMYGIMLGHSEVFWGSSPVYVLTGWTGVLALLGAGRHLLDVSNNFTAYLGAAAYPVYIIHEAILVAIAYYVVMLAIPPALQYLAIVIFSVLLTFACYEILRRIPVVRALFGIAGPEKKPA
ncbi:acyltransferase family protein [uncultured Methanoregula sp.]|uniref:acyltransferase family protein n=1 Tax=uncultured Methanoregula sp. TaxID=1005933 RepID=UPI002AAB3CFD|nr:acyltransferase family protein [uncultured Methanoregula sp.]